MTRRTATIVAIAGGAALVTAVTAVVAVGALGGTDAATRPPSASPLTDPSVPAVAEGADAPEMAADFLASWVDGGRVVRRDQGGDTVSEGQAYGMLAAVLADDEPAFDAIHDWTDEHLVRADGLMAWQWKNGVIVDDEPASDADLDAARALVLAGDRFDRPDLTDAGTAIATVIADELTVETAAGRILLPGLWAGVEPYAYNPSYASPVAFALLGSATGDPRWAELQAGSAAVTASMLSATALPPDWAQVHADGTIDAMPGAAGGGDQPVQYGYDAARLALRYAESCEPSDRALAAETRAPLGDSARLPAVLDLGGGALTDDRHPLALVARAAASASGGDSAAARTDLRSAGTLSNEVPSYYGRAWSALGTAMLTSTRLGGCAALTPGGSR